MKSANLVDRMFAWQIWSSSSRLVIGLHPFFSTCSLVLAKCSFVLMIKLLCSKKRRTTRKFPMSDFHRFNSMRCAKESILIDDDQQLFVRVWKEKKKKSIDYCIFIAVQKKKKKKKGKWITKERKKERKFEKRRVLTRSENKTKKSLKRLFINLVMKRKMMVIISHVKRHDCINLEPLIVELSYYEHLKFF